MSRVLSADWVVPVEGEPIPDGALAIGDDGRIEAVGRAAELGVGEHFESAVIFPGFVNAHTHLEYATYAGFGDGLPFAPWIGLHVARKNRLDTAAMTDIARAGAADSLQSGVTTVGDLSFSGGAAIACSELGLRAIVYLEVFGDAGAIADSFEPMRDRIAPSLSDRVRLGVSPHAPYTVLPELYAACLELGLPVATHFSESADEAAYLRDGSGAWSGLAEYLVAPLGTSGIRALAERGLLSSSIVAAHCVTVDAEEIALLVGHDVGVVHCPRSNAMLGCGVAPLAELRAAGIRVSVGTDSPASAPSFDMFEELRAAVYAARARAARPDALSAVEALELGTLAGARVLGLEREIGSLRPGKQADLAVLSLEGSPFWPVDDPAAAIVLGGASDRVIATFVGGDERFRKGSTAWHDLRSRAQEARSRMLR